MGPHNSKDNNYIARSIAYDDKPYSSRQSKVESGNEKSTGMRRSNNTIKLADKGPNTFSSKLCKE